MKLTRALCALATLTLVAGLGGADNQIDHFDRR
jgi:hypothetical protein